MLPSPGLINREWWRSLQLQYDSSKPMRSLLRIADSSSDPSSNHRSSRPRRARSSRSVVLTLSTTVSTIDPPWIQSESITAQRSCFSRSSVSCHGGAGRNAARPLCCSAVSNSSMPRRGRDEKVRRPKGDDLCPYGRTSVVVRRGLGIGSYIGRRVRDGHLKGLGPSRT